MSTRQNDRGLTATGWLEEEARRIRLPLSGGIIAAVERFDALLLKWNQTINLTRMLDAHERARFLYLESFWGAHLCPIQGNLVDLGSGCGFPALAFKLTYPESSVVLVESRNRKCHFLKEAIRTLQLEGVEVRNERIETLPLGDGSDGRHFCWRAVSLGAGVLESLAAGLPTGGSLIFFGSKRSSDQARVLALRGFQKQVFQSFPHAGDRLLLQLVKCST